MKRFSEIIEPAMGILLFIMVLAVMVLAACSTTAPPAQVDTDVPAQYRETAPAEQGSWQPAHPADGADRGAWWEVYGDSGLDALEAQSREANPGLASALARVHQARAEAGLADADRMPQLSADDEGDTNGCGQQPIHD